MMVYSQIKPRAKAFIKQLSNPYALAFLTFAIIYILFFILYSLQKHAAFLTAGYDLGIWDQKLWNILHGRPFIITTQAEVRISLGDHVDIIALVLAPLYGLYSAPQTLIVFQVIWVSLGALPIYWLAQEKLSSPLAGVIFAVVYLLFPALESAISFDFHGLTVAVPLLAYGLWAITRRRYRLFVVFSLLAMLCQEDVPLLTLMMGLYVMAVQRNRRIGGIVAGISLLWFVIANFLIKPAFILPGYAMHLVRYNTLGRNLGEIIFTMLTRPDLVIQQIFGGEKRFYWIRLTMPTAFTAWLDPLTLFIALPLLLINTLSSYPPTYQLDQYHSSVALVPFVTVASINGLYRLLKFAAPHFKYVRPGFLRNSLLGMVLASTLVYQGQFGHTPLGLYFNWPVVTARHRQIEQLLSQIPPQAAVSAQNNLIPRLSQREQIYIYPKIAHNDHQAEYIVLDLDGSLAPFDNVVAYCQTVANTLADRRYGVIVAQDGLLLLQLGQPDRVTRPSQPCFDED